MIAAALLVAVAFAFAWSMGAHYTGACMGMPYASGSIRLRPALWVMAGFTLLGAVLLSRRVLVHVGHGLLAGPRLGMGAAIAVLAAAFLLTTLFTWRRVPTSTIQILVFAVAGVGTARGLAVRWDAIGQLAALWLAAPFVAAALGFLFTRLLDRVAWLDAAPGRLGAALVTVGALASLTMGANDVSNATAVFLTTGFAGPLAAGALGGLGLALGVLTWGRPLLERVAFDVVRMDRRMATAAQAVQALVVLSAVSFGYFTSMNQALIGAMAGAGLARGRQTVQGRVLRGILLGWLVGPAAGLALGFVFGRLA